MSTHLYLAKSRILLFLSRFSDDQPNGWINLTLPHHQHLNDHCVTYVSLCATDVVVLYNNFILYLRSWVFGHGNEKISTLQSHQSQFHLYNHLWKVCIVYANVHMLDWLVNVNLDVSHMFSWHVSVSVVSETKNKIVK